MKGDDFLNLTKDKLFISSLLTSMTMGNIPFEVFAYTDLSSESNDYFTNTPPAIHGEDIEIEKGSYFSAENYKNSLIISDSESSLDKLVVDIVRDNVDINEAGEYEVEYKVTDEGGLSSSLIIKVTVIDTQPSQDIINTPPVIIAEDIKISQGSTFNPLDYVIATDKEDGDFNKNNIKIINNVKINKVGKYTVTYTVRDSGGATTTRTILVTVTPAKYYSTDTNNSNNSIVIENDSTDTNTKSSNTKKPETGDEMFLSQMTLVISLSGLYVINRKIKY